NATAGNAKPFEGLRTGHLVHQVTVDVQERGLVGCRHHMPIPDLLEQGRAHLSVCPVSICQLSVARAQSRGREANSLARLAIRTPSMAACRTVPRREMARRDARPF